MGVNTEGKISLKVELENFKDIAGKLKRGLSAELKQVPLDIEFNNKKIEQQAIQSVGIINDLLSKTRLKNLDLTSILPSFIETINQEGLSDKIRLEIIEGFKSTLINLKEVGMKFDYDFLKNLNGDELKTYIEDLNTVIDAIKTLKGLTNRQRQGLIMTGKPSLKEGGEKEYTKGSKKISGILQLQEEYSDVFQYATGRLATSSAIEDINKKSELSKKDAKDLLGYLLRTKKIMPNNPEMEKEIELKMADVKAKLDEETINALTERINSYFEAYDKIFNSSNEIIEYSKLEEAMENTTNKKFKGMYDTAVPENPEKITLTHLKNSLISVSDEGMPESFDERQSKRTQSPTKENKDKKINYEDKIKDVQSQIDEIENKIKQINDEASVLQAQINEDKKKIDEAQQEIENKENIIKNKKQTREKNIDIANDRKKAFSASIKKAEEDIKNVKAEKKELEKKLNELKQEENDFINTFDESPNQLKQRLDTWLKKRGAAEKRIAGDEIKIDEGQKNLDYYNSLLKGGVKSKKPEKALERLKGISEEYKKFKSVSETLSEDVRKDLQDKFTISHYEAYETAKKLGVDDSELEKEKLESDEELVYQTAKSRLEQKRDQAKKQVELYKKDIEKKKQELDEINKIETEIQTTLQKIDDAGVTEKDFIKNKANKKQQEDIKLEIEKKDNQLLELENIKTRAQQEIDTANKVIENAQSPLSESDSQLVQEVESLKQKKAEQEKVFNEKKSYYDQQSKQVAQLLKKLEQLQDKKKQLEETQRQTENPLIGGEQQNNNANQNSNVSNFNNENNNIVGNTSTGLSPEQLKTIVNLLTQIQTALGTLDDKSDAPSIVQSISNITSALNELKIVLDSISQKNFNLNIGLPNSNPIGQQSEAKRKILKELEQQYNELVHYFGGEEAEEGIMSSIWKEYRSSIDTNKELELRQRKETLTRLFTTRMPDTEDSLSGKIDAYKSIIDELRKWAISSGIDLNNIVSNILSSDEIIKQINNDIDNTNPTTALQNIFQDMKLSIDASMAQINAESKGFSFLSGSAEEAAEAKRKFVEANKEVLQSIISSIPEIEEESSALNNIQNSQFSSISQPNIEEANQPESEIERIEDVYEKALPRIIEAREKLDEAINSQFEDYQTEEALRQQQQQRINEIKNLERQLSIEKNGQLSLFKNPQEEIKKEIEDITKSSPIDIKGQIIITNEEDIQRIANELRENEIQSLGLIEDSTGQLSMFDQMEEAVTQSQIIKDNVQQVVQNRTSDITGQLTLTDWEQQLDEQKKVQENQRLLSEQGRTIQEEEQRKRIEQNKKNLQFELEQSKAIEQTRNIQLQRISQEQARKQAEIREYEKQFFDWNEENGDGQLTFLDKNDYDLQKYREEIHKEIIDAEKIAQEEAKNNSIQIPLEVEWEGNKGRWEQSFFTEDLNRIDEAEKFYAKISKQKDFIQNEDISQAYLEKYESIPVTENLQKLFQAIQQLKEAKYILQDSFDENNELIGDPTQVVRAYDDYVRLRDIIKKLKLEISGNYSEETIALKLAKDAQTAQTTLDNLKNKIQSNFNNQKYEIFATKGQDFVEKYGLKDANNNLISFENLDGNSKQTQENIFLLNQELQNYRNLVNDLKTKKDNPLISLEELKKVNDAINESKEKITGFMGLIKTQGDTIASEKAVSKMALRISAFMEKNPRITSEAAQELNNYFRILTSGSSITVSDLNKIEVGFNKLYAAQSQAGKLGMNVWTNMTLKIREATAFLATKFSFYHLFNQFRQGMQVVRQFDDALTEMQKVSDETLYSLQRYQKASFDVASSIGADALQIQNSTADFMRLGESLKEAGESAKVANILMNVSEFQSIDEATQSLIAMGAAYDDLTKMNIIDKLNEVGNNYAISTSEAATALQASASALKTANNDMDEALALVTAGNAVVQDATKVGTGIRTIALRLTGTESAKAELEEMGEETENVITTQSKLRDVIKEATAVESNEFKGFDILNNNGNYKSTYEIMLGIAEVYDEIVETDKKLGRNNVNLLLENVAGKVRANIAASIFQNPEILKKAYKSSQEASGSAMEENQKYMASISGHLAQLTNAWQKMWANAANRDVLNFFIDLAKAVVIAVDKLGLLPSALIAITAYAEILQKNATGGKGGFITAFLRDLAALDTSTKLQTENELDNAQATMVNTGAIKAETEIIEENTKAKLENAAADTIDDAGDVAGAVANSTDAIQNATKGTTILTKKTSLLSGAWGGLVATLGTTGAIVSVVAALATVIGLVGKALYDANKAEKVSIAKEVTQNIKQRQETLSNQIDSYNELKAKLNSGNLSEQETIDIKQQILDIQKSIIEEYGNQAAGLDLINGKLETQLNLIKGISQEDTSQKYYANKEGYDEAIKRYTKSQDFDFKLQYSKDTNFQKEITKLFKESGLEVKPNIMGSGTTTSMEIGITANPKTAIKTLEKTKDSLEELKQDYINNPEIVKEINGYITEISNRLTDAYSIIDENEDTALAGLFGELLVNKKNTGYAAFQKYQTSISNLEDAYISGNVDEIKAARVAYEEAIEAKNNFLQEDGNEKFSFLFDNEDTSYIDLKNREESATELIKSIFELGNIDDIFKKNTKALRKYSKSEKDVLKYASDLYKLDADRVDVEATFEDNAYAGEKFSESLYGLLNSLGWNIDDAGLLTDILVNCGIIQGSVADETNKSSTAFSVFSTRIEDAINNIETLNSVLSESASGKGISAANVEAFNSIFGDKASYALEHTANGYHVNIEKLQQLQKQQSALIHMDYASALNEQYDALNKLNEEYKKAIANGENTTGLSQQQKTVKEQISNIEALIMQYEGANSAYNRWLTAQSGNGERDMYDSIYSGYDTIKDEFERGWAGEKTRSWLDLVLNDEGEEDFDVWTAPATELKKRFDEITKDIKGTGGFSIADFFTVDDDGKTTSQGIWNFFEAIENKQDEVLEEGQKKFVDLEEGWFDFTENGDYKIAKLLGMDVESVQSILRAAYDAGFKVNLDEPIYSIERLKTKAEEANKALGFDINLNPESISQVDKDFERLSSYKDVLQEDSSIPIDIKTDKLEEVDSLMQYLISKKRELTETTLMEIEPTIGEKSLKSADRKISAALGKLQRSVKNRNALYIKDVWNISPSELDTVEELEEAINNIKLAKASPEVDDEELLYLEELLDTIYEKLGLLKQEDTIKLSPSGYMEAAEKLDYINEQLGIAQQLSAKGFPIHLSEDADFVNAINTIINMPTQWKIEYGIDPTASAEELMEMFEAGTFDITAEVAADTTKFNNQMRQDLSTEAVVNEKFNRVNTTTNVTNEETNVKTNMDVDDSAFNQKMALNEKRLEEVDGHKTYIDINANTDSFDEKKDDVEKESEKLEKDSHTIKFKGDNSDALNKGNILLSFINVINGTVAKVTFGASGLDSLIEKVKELDRRVVTVSNRRISGFTQANGSAHYNGTAFNRGTTYLGNAYQSGKWGLSKNQNALVGELGTEIVVRDGNWFTVGDDGAEFVGLKQGDIVFNHKQSRELLENGYVTSNKGRGQLIGSFAHGTALSNGDFKDAIKPTTSSKGMGGSDSSSSGTTSSKDSGGKDKGSDKTAKEAEKTKNTLDEVEILLSRIQRQISRLDNAIANTYSSWSSRNTAITRNLKKVSKEIKEQNTAYSTYIKKANSVGLSSVWKKRIENGEQIIRDVTNNDVWDKIQEYKQWYEKALAAKDAIQELEQKEGELYKQRFDNEQTYYDEVISNIQHIIDLNDAYISQLEEAGKLSSKILITNQKNAESTRLADLNEEYKKLVQLRDKAVASGKIKEGSEAWYEMQEAINEVGNSIEEAETNLISYNNALNEVNWNRWEKEHNAISGVVNELEFLYDLINEDDMFDEEGNITDYGITAQALLAQQYDTYIAEADRYQKEIDEIQKALKEDPYNQTLVDKLKELKEAQQDSIANAKKMKESIVDVTEQGYKKQIEYIKDLISDYEELLESQKDQIEYAEKVADSQKEINKLEKQYRAIQNDDSEEGATKRQKLRTEIEEKRKELEDTQEDRRISEVKDMLSDFEEGFEDFLNEKLKNIETVVKESIDSSNENIDVIKTTIDTLTKANGYTISDTLKNTLSNITNTLVNYFSTGYDSDIAKNTSTIASGVNDIVNYYNKAQADSDAQAKTSLMAQRVRETGESMQSYENEQGQIVNGIFNKDGTRNTTYSGWINKDGNYYRFNNGTQLVNQWGTIGGKQYYFNKSGARVTGSKTIGGKKYYFADDGTMLTGWRKVGGKLRYYNPYMYTGKQTIGGKKYTFDEDGVFVKEGWKKGTASVPTTGFAWTNEGNKAEAIIRKSDGAILTPLNRGDSVIPSSAMRNMYQALTNPEKYLKQYTSPDIRIIQTSSSGKNSSPSTVNMQFIVNGVQDANAFANELMNNKKLEKWVQEITLGQANGNNSYRKYSYAIR